MVEKCEQRKGITKIERIQMKRTFMQTTTATTTTKSPKSKHTSKSIPATMDPNNTEPPIVEVIEEDTEQDVKNEDGNWQRNCGILLSCGLGHRYSNVLAMSFHISALATFMLAAGITIILELIYAKQDMEIILLSNPLRTWFLAVCVLLAVIYLSNILQMCFGYVLARLLGDSMHWGVYFAFRAFVTSIALLSTSMYQACPVV